MACRRRQRGAFLAISPSHSHSCGLKVDGSVACWGYNNYGQSTPPAGAFVAVSAGAAHTCRLKADGSVQCWGGGGPGTSGFPNLDQTTVPAMLESAGEAGFGQIASGNAHACQVNRDGTIACWGNNDEGQATPPAGTYVQVAGGNTFTCAIRNDGARVCWGDDAQGQAPQLQLTPYAIVDGSVGTPHGGANFVLGDFGQNADGDYVPPKPVFYADPADLPPGLSLSTAGVLSGTPTAGGSYTFSVDAEDANGFVASREYSDDNCRLQPADDRLHPQWRCRSVHRSHCLVHR